MTHRLAVLLSLLLLSMPYLAFADLSVPPGFSVSVYATGLGQARGLALSPRGVLHVCDMRRGQVLALRPLQDRTVQAVAVVTGLNKPHSIAFHGGFLYVGETHRVSRFLLKDRPQTGTDGRTVIDLPSEGGHFTRTVVFGPDGRMFVSIGSSCNACEEVDPRRASIGRLEPDGTRLEIFAKGLRNAVGLAFEPGTGALWAAVHGRDWLGDDLPPETVVKVEKGMDYGWPYSYSLRGRAVPDPDLGKKGVRQTGFPVLEIQAHSAPLGITFYEGRVFPAAYRGGLFIALHGSWNRTRPVGYKVVYAPLKDGRSSGEPRDFLWGFREKGFATGRPVDVLTGPAGELFVSDDKAGKVYRITYKEASRKE